MAYELVEEVLDHAPPELDPGARLLLVCIAEECRGGARIRDIPAADLRRRTGLGERGLRHACDRLEAAGLKVRVALALDKHGRPVYALTGKVCRWVLPPMPKPANCPCARCVGADVEGLPREEEAPEVRAPDGEGRAPDVGGMPAGLVRPPKPSLENLLPPGTVDRVTAMAHIRAVTSLSSRRLKAVPGESRPPPHPSVDVEAA